MNNHVISLVQYGEERFEADTIEELFTSFMSSTGFMYEPDAWQEALDDPAFPAMLKLTCDEFEALFKRDVVAGLQFYIDVTRECGDDVPEALEYTGFDGVSHKLV